MYYSTLQLRNYRSYEDYSVELSPSINIVVGPNASGKTNLLESILVASHGSSYRSKDIDLIRFGADWARIEAYTGDEIMRSVSVTLNPDESTDKEIKIDDIIIKRLARSKKSPVTLFEPEHLRMVHGSPELRRGYLDGILEHLEDGYAASLRQYKRALSQRNRLLKRTREPNRDEIFVWDVKLSELGAKIVNARLRLIDTINEKLPGLYSKLSGHKTALEIEYRASVPVKSYGDSFLKKLHRDIEKDLERGFTSAGPHREDMSFMLDGHDAAASASRGETRTIVLSCKLIELMLLEEGRQDKPVLLLDDVFSELDSARRRLLTEYLKNYQTIITTTDADAIIKHFIGDYNVIPTTTQDSGDK